MTDTYSPPRDREFAALGCDYSELAPYILGVSCALHRSPYDVTQALLNLLKTVEPYRSSKQDLPVSRLTCNACGKMVEPNDIYAFYHPIDGEIQVFHGGCSPAKERAMNFCELCGDPVPDDDYPHKTVRCEACCKPISRDAL